ncbi:MAG TPA: hypothetical protein VHS74_05750 [Solirubrobacterales bacterium]|nr:hypothetical protein [Solirubrobacterales bacterium]
MSGALSRRLRKETDYESLDGRLWRARCPHKLYEQRLRALEVLVGEPLVARVEEEITNRLPEAGAAGGWQVQFRRDLKTYGLNEAILYFHSYPPLAEGFVEEAAQLYEDLARLYLSRHEEIVRSDDPRVLVQLNFLRELGDSSEHTGPQALRQPRCPNGDIADPVAPEPDLDYEPVLPTDWVFLDVTKDFTGGKHKLIYGGLADELVETISAEWMFQGFPGIQAAFFDACTVLDDHEIEVFGSEGQYVLESLVRRLHEEMFGDYERWIPCGECGSEFKVSVTLESVDRSLCDGGWVCGDCAR